MMSAEQSTFYKKVEISKKNSQYKELRKEKTEVWIKYSSEISSYESAYSGKQSIFDSVEYYLKKKGKLLYVGKVNKDGLFDKSGNLLQEVHVAEKVAVLGISADTLKAPLDPNLVIKREDGSISSSNPFVFISFDLDNENIKVYVPDL
jgi:hypothetical protein